MNRLLLVAATSLLSLATYAEKPAMPTITVTHSEIEGIGAEPGVMRRDPSDIIKVGDLYYVWYSKGKISPGYDATVWYATSTDGQAWEEKGMALAKGEPGSWEGASVFTPNILVAEDRYWLFYTRNVQKVWQRLQSRFQNRDRGVGFARRSLGATGHQPSAEEQ